MRAGINAEDPVARVGTLDRMKVLVYVDEPDLGKVRMGLPATPTWDALPGREWTGVSRLRLRWSNSLAAGRRGDCPGPIAPAGPAPGANIDARLKAQVVEGALTIPRQLAEG